MSELSQNRINFIDQLHEAFLTRKGHGAFAYLSSYEVLFLFDKFLHSNEAADLFINRFVRSV